MPSKLFPLLLLLLVSLTYSCNFERNGDESEYDEDLFSGPDRSKEPDVTLSDQSPWDTTTTNTTNYDGTARTRVEELETAVPDSLRYLRTPENFSTSKDIPNTTGIEGSNRRAKPDPLGRDKDYDGAYKEHDPKKVDDHRNR